MKFLVTGGAGFIGGNFLLEMVKKYPNDDYVCLDALTYAGNRITLKDIEGCKNFKFVHGNICDKELVDQLFKEERFDYVINFAAETHVDRASLYPDIFVKTNIEGTQTLLDACRKYGIKRFHQVSTDEVYGDLGSLGAEGLFTESTPYDPRSPYSASKAASDHLVMAWHHTYGLPVLITNCSNNYGPFHFPEKLIPLVILNALDGKPLPIYGKGDNVRDWLYVADHCEAIDLIVRHGVDGEVYNVGGHNEKTNIYIVKTILKELGKPESLIHHVTDRPGHDLRYAIDPSKVEKLGWRPKYTFETAIKETIEWNIKHADWIEAVGKQDANKFFEEYYAERR
ncbi:MAG: dTDP-glucose 4,6-dehydratase [bacterium ADurb.BinA186]|nr:MAG: dTDP-glucose 4,6-dehydratase [bacterium ADurb.BinA186]